MSHRQYASPRQTTSSGQTTFQALDPYIAGSWRSLLTEPDMIQYYEAKRQGSIHAALRPPMPHLVQVSQFEYDAPAWTFDRENPPMNIPFFVNDRKGISVSNAFAKMYKGLQGAEKSVGPLSNSDKTTYRIRLPGHSPFDKHSPARRATVDREYLLCQTVAHHVARAVKACIDGHGGSWQDDNAGTVTFEQLLLLEVRRVSEGSWQPVLAVYRY